MGKNKLDFRWPFIQGSQVGLYLQTYFCNTDIFDLLGL